MGPRQTRRKELRNIWAAERREPKRLVLVTSVMFFEVGGSWSLSEEASCVVHGVVWGILNQP